MSTEKSYNGWKNYETWAVKLWIDNDSGSYSYWLEVAQEVYDAAKSRYEWETKNDAFITDLAERLKDEHEEAMPTAEASVYTDLLMSAMQEVDWREIAETYLDEIDKEEDEVGQPEESEA